MARRVKWSAPALANLERAASYIAEDSPRYAAVLVREARDAARTLRQVADRGRVVPEIGDQRFRELFVGNYRLIYRIVGEEVQIVAFVHFARDLGRSRL